MDLLQIGQDCPDEPASMITTVVHSFLTLHFFV